MECFKLRDKHTGLFSAGGRWARFTREGKTWSSLKNIKAHLRLCYERYNYTTRETTINIPDHLEVVKGTFIPSGTTVMLAKDLFNQ